MTDWVPVPVSVWVVGELGALLINEVLPDAAPEAWGEKVTVKGALCPAASVTGKVIPLTEYPGPFQLAEEIVTAEAPAVSVPVLMLLLPTVTFPKASWEGEAESAPGSAIPVFDAAIPPPQPVSRVAAISTSAARYLEIRPITPYLQPTLCRAGRIFHRDPKYMARLTMDPILP
jgi:hypothetical protein